MGHGISRIIYGKPKRSLDDVKRAIREKDVVHLSFPIAGKETDDKYKVQNNGRAST